MYVLTNEADHIMMSKHSSFSKGREMLFKSLCAAHHLNNAVFSSGTDSNGYEFITVSCKKKLLFSLKSDAETRFPHLSSVVFRGTSGLGGWFLAKPDTHAYIAGFREAVKKVRPDSHFYVVLSPNDTILKVQELSKQRILHHGRTNLGNAVHNEALCQLSVENVADAYAVLLMHKSGNGLLMSIAKRRYSDPLPHLDSPLTPKQTEGGYPSATTMTRAERRAFLLANAPKHDDDGIPESDSAEQHD